MKAIILYATYSGNTEEIADIIDRDLQKVGVSVERYDIFQETKDFHFLAYDLVFLGSFTWDYGSVPDEMVDFLSRVKLDHPQVAVFGSGDTQFGGDLLYCRAVDILCEKFSSKWEGLKIEQSPRGTQEGLITNWMERVLEDVQNFNESKNIRTSFSK